jgi:hypothetical protein
MEIIRSPADLVAGDVLYISKLVRPRDRDEYWWRAYWIVKAAPRHKRQTWVEGMVLKMHPDPDKDHRLIDFDEKFETQVIQFLPENDHPQGVSAMRMKHIALGTIKLGA